MYVCMDVCWNVCIDVCMYVCMIVRFYPTLCFIDMQAKSRADKPWLRDPLVEFGLGACW